MEITGRIFTINRLTDKSAQIVIKKQMDGKVVPIAIEVFGFWKEKMEAMHLNKNDKISGKFYLKSNLYKGKYYTNIYFKSIEKVEDKQKNTFATNSGGGQRLFEKEDDNMLNGIGNIIDEDTGEVLL